MGRWSYSGELREMRAGRLHVYFLWWSAPAPTTQTTLNYFSPEPPFPDDRIFCHSLLAREPNT